MREVGVTILQEKLAELVRRGIVRPPLVVFHGPPPRHPVAPTEDVLTELAEDREDR